MGKMILLVATTMLATACQSGDASNQASKAALNSAEEKQARWNAAQDAIQAQRQLELVRAHTANAAQQDGEHKK
jgi:hypothetical protein